MLTCVGPRHAAPMQNLVLPASLARTAAYIACNIYIGTRPKFLVVWVLVDWVLYLLIGATEITVSLRMPLLTNL